MGDIHIKGSKMSFLYPEYLFFIIPLVVFLYKTTNSFTNKMHTIILLLLFISLSRPVYEKVEQDSVIDAKDIVIALDVSLSMMADDIKPNRYEYAKKSIEEFLKLNPNDNVMLIAFTTNPLLLSPPTTDHNLILTSLKALNTEYILTKGTSLLNLFEKLKEIGVKDKNLILITDGGEESELDKLTQTIKYETKSLTILALGDHIGSTIPTKDGSLLKDSDSNLVISRVNPFLEQLASSLDATYIKGGDLATQIATLISSTIEDSNNKTTKKENNFKEYYQIPLFLATMLFLMLHTKGIKYLLIVFAFLASSGSASMLDNYYLDSGYKSYNQQNYKDAMKNLENIELKSLQSEIIKANTLYKMGEYEQALKLYLQIKSTDANVKKGLNYNIANCFAMLGNYQDAKIFYAKTLSFGEDREASENLKKIIFKENRKSKDDGKKLPTSQQMSQKDDEFEAKDKNSKDAKKGQNDIKDTKERYPISSKTYELINKGYIDETKPW